MTSHPPYWYWDNQLTLKEVKKLNKLIMSKYDLEAIPVVNKKKELLGRITIDDIVDFIKEEAD